MFKDLEKYLEKHDLTIALSKKEDKISVSVLPRKKSKSEDAITNPSDEDYAPLVITGTSSELDEGFINAINVKLEKMNGLQVKAEELEESIENEEEAETKSKTKSSSKSKSKTSAPAAKKEEPKKKEESDNVRGKRCIKEGDDFMLAKKYKEAKKSYTDALSVFPDDKKIKQKLENATRWDSQVSAMYADDKKEEIKKSTDDPNQKSLLDHPNVHLVSADNKVVENVHSDESTAVVDDDQEDNGQTEDGEDIELNFG